MSHASRTLIGPYVTPFGLPSLLRLAAAAVIAYSAVHLAYSMAHYNVFAGTSSGDFNRAFGEASHLRDTGALSLEAVLHPPLYYVLLWPFLDLGMRGAAYVFYFGQIALYCLGVLFLVKAVTAAAKPSAAEYLIAAVLTVNFQPFLETLALHKVEGIEFFLICAAIYAFRRKRDGLTGSLVCVAANLKYLPGLLAVYFLLKRHWKVVGGLLVTLLGCLAVLVAVFGIGDVAAYGVRHPMALLFEHHHEGTVVAASFEFQTLTGTINRWLAGPEGMAYTLETQNYSPVHNQGLAVWMSAALKILLGGLYVWLIRRSWPASQRQAKWERYLLEISLTLIMIFVIAPASRVHYAILLLPAFIIAALLLYRRRGVFRLTEKVLFGAAYGLTAMIIPGGLLNRLPPHPLWGQKYSYVYLWMSLPFYGYLLLGLCVVICYYRLERAPEGDAGGASEAER